MPSLLLHPGSPRLTGVRIAADAVRQGGVLRLRYVACGRIAEMRLAKDAPPMRADGLWRHTCFEAFVRPLRGEAYREFNFSPSRAWAAYDFDAYRSGMREAPVAPPRAEARASADRFELSVRLDLANAAPFRLGLCAVIETAEGALSYWALAHPPGRADFHHRDCFALELAAPSPP
jgi:hypothetical protein